MLLHNYLDSAAYTLSLAKNNFSEISDTEIKSIKKRVDFYINHFKISSKNLPDNGKAQQIEFLMNIKYLLESELKERSYTLCAA